MNATTHISDVRFIAASEESKRSGLLGWVRASYGFLLLDGIALRRTRDGRLTLSFPARDDRAGVRRYLIKPLDDHARRSIEIQVMTALGFKPEEVSA